MSKEEGTSDLPRSPPNRYCDKKKRSNKRKTVLVLTDFADGVTRGLKASSCIESLIKLKFKPGERLYLAIDRTQWKTNNLFVLAIIVRKVKGFGQRAIAIYWKRKYRGVVLNK